MELGWRGICRVWWSAYGVGVGLSLFCLWSVCAAVLLFAYGVGLSLFCFWSVGAAGLAVCSWGGVRISVFKAG
jgi:hypothetical protein